MKKLLQLSLLIIFILVAAGGLYAHKTDSTEKTVDAGTGTRLATPEQACQNEAIGA
jgi:hypothetical protein